MVVTVLTLLSAAEVGHGRRAARTLAGPAYIGMPGGGRADGAFAGWPADAVGHRCTDGAGVYRRHLCRDALSKQLADGADRHHARRAGDTTGGQPTDLLN